MPGFVPVTIGNLLVELGHIRKADLEVALKIQAETKPHRRLGEILLERRLVDDGCLLLGVDESLEGETVAFRAVNGRRGLYVKAPSALRRAA